MKIWTQNIYPFTSDRKTVNIHKFELCIYYQLKNVEPKEEIRRSRGLIEKQLQKEKQAHDIF